MASMYNNYYNYLTSVNPDSMEDILNQARYVIEDHMQQTMYIPKFYYVAIETKPDGDFIIFLLRSISEYYATIATRDKKNSPIEINWYVVKYPQRGQPVRMIPLAEQAVNVISTYETKLSEDYMKMIDSL